MVNTAFTGTFTQTANGRASLTLTTAANSSLVVWMVSPSRGFFVVNDPEHYPGRHLDLQQSATFSNATMNGQLDL